MTTTLVLASHNAKKLAELQALFTGLPLVLRSAAELGFIEPDEPHVTFLENALAKARHAARLAGGPAIADDSGLVVDALGGAPGVASAHYAPAPPVDVASAAGDDPRAAREALRRRQDAVNNARLLADLAALGPSARRDAAFVCTLVALRHADDPEPLVAVGRWAGRIVDDATAARGQGGFGYDPLLFIPALGATVAELDPAVKNRESHRALAARALAGRLRQDWHLG
jgi:XTP/dITP diphosphohydrolase